MPAAAAGELPAGSAGAERAIELPAGGVDVDEGDAQHHPNCELPEIDHAGHLMTSKFTLDLLVEKGVLRVVSHELIRWLIENRTIEQYCGGEATVYVVRWEDRGIENPINDGAVVAIKVYIHPEHKGQKPNVWDEVDLRRQVHFCKSMLRQEVNILNILDKSGCGGCIPSVDGIFRHEGSLQRDKDPPLYGYVMPHYEHGSLAQFLHRTCYRLLPESLFASFFSPVQLAAHYHKLHDMLLLLSRAEVSPQPAAPADKSAPIRQAKPAARLPAGTAPAPQAPSRPRRHVLLLQDISSNNLLLKETVAGTACELLFADPSRAQLAAHLKRPTAKKFVTATWLWGCMAAQYGLVDETADVFSTNICMLELWGVAEGAPMPLNELGSCLRLRSNRPMGVTLLRALCTAMLKRHALGSRRCSIVPRIRRELPLSWLMLWAILLGCDDFHSPDEMESGRHHRRPSVADMADVAARLKTVAAQMEALQGGMTEAALEAPAGAALVQECVQLYNRLAALARLDDPELLPADSSLCWVATRFLQQQHPLVAALKRRGALPLGKEDERSIKMLPYRERDFEAALVEAEVEARWVGDEREIKRLIDDETEKLQVICKEYRECQLEVLRLVPDDSPAAHMLRSRQVPPELRPFMEGLPPLPPPAEQPQPASTKAQLPVADAVGAPAASAQLPAGAANPTAAAVQPPDSICAAPAAAPTVQAPAAGPAAPSVQPAQACSTAPVQPTAPPLPAPVPAPFSAPVQQASLHPAAPATQLAAAPSPLAFQGLVPQPALPPAAAVQQAAGVPAAPASQIALAPAGAAAPAPPPQAALLPQLGVQLPPQPALEWLGLTQPVQLAAGQPTSGFQPCASPQYQQQPLAGQVPGGVQAAVVASPCLPPSPALSMVPAPVDAEWMSQVSAAFGLGPSQRQQLGPAVPGALLDYSSPSFHAHIATVAAAGTAPWQQAQGPALGFGAASTPAPALCQPASPTKKRRLELGSSMSRAASAPPASPAPPPLPRPRAYCDLLVEPAPTAGGQPALPPAQLPGWVRQLMERRAQEAAAQPDSLAAGAPSASCAASPAAGCALVLSGQGQRMAAAVAAGLRMPEDPSLCHKKYRKADVERYATALERLLTSEHPPAGLEAQWALFRPIDTAAKLAWFLGWWASKDSTAPRIPGLDAGKLKLMDCNNSGKAAWTKAVLIAAAQGGAFAADVETSHGRTMPYVAHALLLRLLAGRPLFAAAVAKEMQEM